MADKSLNVRIQNKFDSYEKWMASSLILKAGEIAIATIPSGDNTGLTPPAIGVKVGDGSKTFAQLSWIQATAGDVYGWAKAATKPEYKASEITGLEDFIAGEIQDTNTKYSFSLKDNYKIEILKKDVDDADFVALTEIDLTNAFNAKADKVTGAVAGNFAGLDASGNLVDSGAKAADFATAAQGAKADSAVQSIVEGSANGTISVDGTDVSVHGLGTAAYTSADAYAPAGHAHDDKYAAKAATESHIADGDIHVTADQKTAWTTGAEKAATNESAISGIKNGTSINDFAAVESAIAGINGTASSDKEELEGKISEASEAAAGALAEAQAKVASVAAGDASVTIGGTATAPTVAAKLSADADNALELAEDGLKVVIPAAAEYTIEKAADSGEFAAIYNLKKDGVVVGASINIPKDLVVKSGRVENGEIVLVLNDEANTEIKIAASSLIEYVTSGSQTGDMVVISVSDDHKVTATITDGSITLAKLSTEIQTAIGKAHTHENASVLDGITAAKVEAWDAAEKNAKDHADSLNTAMNTRVEALEAIDHDHSNKDVLDGISAEKVAAWDAAQANVIESISGVAGSMEGKDFKVTGVSTDLLTQGSDVLIFNCGTSAE